MKVTKNQIRRIIREEKTRLLNEGSLQGTEERFANALDEYVMALDESMGYDIPNDQLKAEVMNLVDGHFADLEAYELDPMAYQ
jgi:hypothetical protein